MVTWSNIPDGDIDPESPIDTPLMTALRDNPTAIAQGDANAPRVQRAAIKPGVGHRWFFDYGDQSDGVITHSANADIPPGLYQCTTFTIDLAVTVGLSSKGPLVICATTSITINGTLDVDGDGGGSMDIGSANRAGQSGIFGGAGGGGSGSGDGLRGGCVYMASGGSGSGGSGKSQSARTKATLLSLMPIFNVIEPAWFGATTTFPWLVSYDYAAVGGGGGAFNTVAPYGHGGGLVVLCAPTITVGAAGVITADGINGGGPGQGGGGGGAIIIATPAEGYTNYGSVAANAGTATNGGGAGGAGWVETITL